MRLIIGGSSSVGKTTVARDLCSRLDLALAETDRTLPRLAQLRPLDGSMAIWDRPTTELRSLLSAAALAAIPHLLDQISHLSKSCERGWIVEGERVHPLLVDRLVKTGVAQGIFIVEVSAQCLYMTLIRRLPGFKELSATRRRAVAEVDRLYNLWLISETRKLGLICIAAQPWTTLPERILVTARAGRE